MLKRFFVTALLAVVLAWVAAPPAFAIDCDAAVKDGQHNLALVEAQVKNLREANQHRVQNFLDEARRLLKEARADCDRAQSDLDKAGAAAKAALAQGDIAAAHIFIKLD